jgi:uncharacterized cupin superfamily protein
VQSIALGRFLCGDTLEERAGGSATAFWLTVAFKICRGGVSRVAWALLVQLKGDPMLKTPIPAPVAALDIAPRTKPSNYPEPFFSRMNKRVKRQLGDAFGLQAFGVNLTRLLPGGESALMHTHSKQDEFIYVLEGTPTLATESGETLLGPGMCVGFAAQGEAHHLVNRSDQDVVLLEIGDRPEGDEGSYPQDNIQAVMGPDGKWQFTHKGGQPY